MDPDLLSVLLLRKRKGWAKEQGIEVGGRIYYHSYFKDSGWFLQAGRQHLRDRQEFYYDRWLPGVIFYFDRESKQIIPFTETEPSASQTEIWESEVKEGTVRDQERWIERDRLNQVLYPGVEGV